MKKYFNFLLFFLTACSVNYPLIESGNYLDLDSNVVEIIPSRKNRSLYYISGNKVNGVQYTILNVNQDSTGELQSPYQYEKINCIIKIDTTGVITIYNDTLNIILEKWVGEEKNSKSKKGNAENEINF